MQLHAAHAVFLIEENGLPIGQQASEKTLAYVKSLLVSRKEWKAKQDAKQDTQPRYHPGTPPFLFYGATCRVVVLPF
jgi:hypothetical protein